jgi:hypothetical protein
MLTRGLSSLLQNAGLGMEFWPILLPQAACLPAATFHIIGGTSEATFEGSGLQKLRIQFDVFSRKSYDEASGKRDQLRAFLNGYRGTLSDGTVLLNVDLIQVIDFFDYDPRQWRCVIEFYFYFTFSS